MKRIKRYYSITIYVASVIFLLLSSCKKDQEEDVVIQAELPVLSTNQTTNLTESSATSGGNVTGNGITARGVCWSSSGQPTVADNKTADGSGSGEFISNITGLDPNTYYAVRAYATNSAGTAYGNIRDFTTPEFELPILSTEQVSGITASSANSGGDVTYDGGTAINTRGVCWNQTGNPTTNDNKTEDGSGTGSFSSNISNLDPNTTYYVRAYATNNSGTAYGNSISFNTSGNTFTDPRDGKVYETVIIGSQEWMAENLAYEPSSGNFWAYDNDNSNVAIYGYLYDWQTAMNACPTGWHLPSSAEWQILSDYLGGNSIAGGKMKVNSIIWNSPNSGATNSSGFSAIPGGLGTSTFGFDEIGERAHWWSSTDDTSNGADSRLILNSFESFDFVQGLSQSNGLSCRCLKN